MSFEPARLQLAGLWHLLSSLHLKFSDYRCDGDGCGTSSATRLCATKVIWFLLEFCIVAKFLIQWFGTAERPQLEVCVNRSRFANDSYEPVRV